MHDDRDPRHARHSSEQDGYSHYDTPLVRSNDGVGGTRSGQGKFGGVDPSSGDDDDTQVNTDLLNNWMQRLQVLTVVTAFLASMDGQMFSLTALNTQIGLPLSNTSRQIIYSCLSGALIFHICATTLGYIGSFALIRYRIIEDITKRPSRRVVLEPILLSSIFGVFPRRLRSLRFLSGTEPSRTLSPPLTLLMHCYFTILCLAAAGFVLALTGILTFVWAGLPAPVGIFSTICLGIAVSAVMWAIAL